MKRILLSLGLSLLGVYGMAQMSGTYTIDAGSPSSATNFQTFSAAFDELTSSGVSGAVTINVVEGTYSEQLYYNNASIPGASATNTITIQSDAGNSNMPLLEYSSYPVYFYYCDFSDLTIRGIHFNSTSSYSSVLRLYYGSYTRVTWEDNYVEGTTYGSTSSSYATVYHYRTTNNDVKWINNEVSDGSYGFYIYYNYGTSGEAGLTLDGNAIEGAYEAAIYQYYSYSCRFEFINNTMHTSSGNNECYGIYSYYMPPGSRFDNNEVTIENTYTSTSSAYELYALYMYYLGDDVENLLPEGNASVSGNKIHVMNDASNYHWGMRIYYPRGSSGNNNRIANNFISNEGGTYISYGAYIYYAAFTDFINNSIYWESTYSSSYPLYMYTGSSSTSYGGCTLANNIVQTTSTNPYTAYVRQYVNFTAGNNLFYNGSAMKTYWYTPTGGLFYDLNSFEAGSGTSGNFMIDPEFFTPPQDLHLFNANIDGAGMDVGLDHDIDDDFRITSSPDIGADEFGVDHNAQPAGMTSPNAPICAEDTCLGVVIANTGNLNLTTLDVVYTFNGGVPVTEQWTGNLSPGQLDTLTLGCNWSFIDGDSIAVYTASPNGQLDSLALNDTITTVIYYGLAGTYNIPGDYVDLTDAAADLNKRGVCDAVIMDIAPGTYNENISLRDIAGTDIAKTVTWRSSTGNAEDVLVEFAGTSTNYAVVSLNQSDWQIFEDLTFHNTSSSYARVFELSNEADNNTIQRSELMGTYTNSSSENYSIVWLNGPNYNTSIMDNHLIAGGISVHADGGGDNYNTVITGNNMDDWGYYGIRNYYYGGSTIADNQIVNDTTNGSCYYGIYNYYSPGTNIDRNYIAAPYSTYGIGYGIYQYYSNGTGSNRVSVSNNCVTIGRDGYTGYGYRGMYVYGGFYDIMGNTVTKIAGATGTSYTPLYIGTGGSIAMRNNILVDYVSTYAFYSSSAYNIVDADNNDFYTNSSSLVYNAAAYNTLEDYQNATGFGMNSLNVDPAFSDTTYCATCSEELDGAGDASAIYSSVDVDSNERNQMTPDIGAVEFVVASEFNLGPDSTYCEDELTIYGGPAQNITWSVDGNASTEQDLTLETNGEAETFNVLLILETEHCGTAAEEVEITLVPNASLDSNVHLCVGDMAQLDPGGLATGSYLWSNGETTKVIQVDEPGAYTVNKSVMGCESMATVIVTQSDAIEFATTEVCSDALPLQLDASIYNGISYAWTGGTSPTSAMNDFNDAGPYSVTATDAYGCSDVEDFVVNVLEDPIAVITVPTSSGNIYTFDASTSNYLTTNSTVNWSFGAGATPMTSTNIMETVTYPWSNPASPTSYTVTLEVSNECDIDNTSMLVTPDPLGVEDAEEGGFAIFPNPAKDVVTITTANAGAGSIQVQDMSGRTVMNLPVNVGSNNHQLDVSGLAAGSYMVRVSSAQSVTTKQLIIE